MVYVMLSMHYFGREVMGVQGRGMNIILGTHYLEVEFGVKDVRSISESSL